MIIKKSLAGFHLGPGGNATGIKSDYLQLLHDNGLRFFIKSVDAYGPCYEAVGIAKTGTINHNIVFRLTTAGQNDGYDYDVPPYHESPEVAAQIHWQHTKNKIEGSIPEFDKSYTWLEVINEVDKNRAEWLGLFATAIAILANNDGYKVALFGWSSGEPERENWYEMEPYLRYCSSHLDQAAISLHEYDFNQLGFDDVYPWHVGRFQILFDVCDNLGISRPKVFITEYGWSYDDVPDWPTSEDYIHDCNDLYLLFDEIQGQAIWYLGGGFGNIANKVQPFIQPVGQLTLNYNYDVPNLPTDGIRPIDPALHEDDNNMTNLLNNPSFEGGWYHPDNIPELQIPDNWAFWYADDTIPNPYDSNSWAVFVRPEVRVLPKEQLPPNEQDVFVTHGNQCVKVFKGHGSWYGRLSQSVNLLAGHEYKLKVSLFADLVFEYVDGEKVWSNDPNQKDGLCRLLINGEAYSDWVWLQPGTHIDLEFYFTTAGMTHIDIEFMCPYPLANNGLFLDNWSLTVEPVQSVCVGLPRQPYNREYWVVDASRTTEEQRRTIYQMAANEGKTVGPSYDDAGIGDLPNKKAVIFKDQSLDEQEFIDWYNTHYPGTEIEFRWIPGEEPTEFFFSHWPTDYTEVNQWFGENPEYYQQFGLPGHEGIDVRCDHDGPIYAAFSGVVSDLHPPSSGHNYGVFVRVRQGKYELTYAHLNSISVNLGDTVTSGQIIGYGDSTGNSTGTHLHFTLKHDDAYEGGTMYIGYPYNIIDPTPFISPYVENPHNVLFGVHASADGYNFTNDVGMIQQAKVTCMKVLSSHNPNDVSQLANVAPNSEWVIRAFLSMGGRDISPEQFYNDTFSDTKRTVDILRGHGVSDDKIWIELHNEPNLVTEGLGDSWQDGGDFANWLINVLSLYKSSLPNVKMLYPGLSPGGNIPNLRIGHREFLTNTITGQAISLCDGIAVHSYWSNGYPMTGNVNSGIGHIQDILSLYPGNIVWVTESSNNQAGVTPEQKANEYITFWQQIKSIPAVKGVTYFVLSASHGGWQWEGGTGEIWTPTMAQIVGGR